MKTPKYKTGDIVSPKIAPEIEMLVYAIIIDSGIRYSCSWAVEGKIETASFNEYEIQPVAEKRIGFNK